MYHSFIQSSNRQVSHISVLITKTRLSKRTSQLLLLFAAWEFNEDNLKQFTNYFSGDTRNNIK